MVLQEMESNLRSLQKQATVLEKAIEEFKKNSKPKTIYDLRDGDKYWVVGYDGAINGCTFLNAYTDEKIISIGSAFLTEEEAKYEVKCREVYTQLKKYSYDFSYDEWHDVNIIKYRMYFDTHTKEINIDLTHSLMSSFLYFKSKKDIQVAIKEIGKENIIKYYFIFDFLYIIN